MELLQKSRYAALLRHRMLTFPGSVRFYLIWRHKQTDNHKQRLDP